MNKMEKTMIFDVLYTADGHEIFWLHVDGENRIDPDDLFCDKYNFMDTCEHIVTDGRPYLNYAIEEEVIAEWEKEKEEIANERGEDVMETLKKEDFTLRLKRKLPLTEWGNIHRLIDLDREWCESIVNMDAELQNKLRFDIEHDIVGILSEDEHFCPRI